MVDFAGKGPKEDSKYLQIFQNTVFIKNNTWLEFCIYIIVD